MGLIYNEYASDGEWIVEIVKASVQFSNFLFSGFLNLIFVYHYWTLIRES